MKSPCLLVLLAACLTPSASLAAAVPCKGGDLTTAETARSDAKATLKQILRLLDSGDPSIDSKLQEWFGASNKDVRAKVAQVLGKSLFFIEGFSFYCNYANNGSMVEAVAPGSSIRVDKAGSLFAYVDPVDLTKLYLGLAFYRAPGSGYNSKLGTVVHELTHFELTGKTDDVEYSQKECRDLAKQSVEKALKNADSYEYFVESVLAN